MSDAGWPPPGGGWGQPPVGWQPQPGYGGQEIPNHLVWAILTTVFCCLPAGIVSIVYAAQVSSKQAVGDIAGALQASNRARTWAIVSAVAALVWIPLVLLLIVFGTAVELGV